MIGVGLFRRKSKGVGQKTDSEIALGSNLNSEARLEGRRALEFELDLLINEISAVAEDINSMAGSARHQRFTDQCDEHEHFRCITQVLFWDTRPWPDAAFYIEHPESKRLLPIVKAIKDRRCNGNSVVWVSDFNSTPMVVPETCTMYVSDEPAVAGKTIEQVRMRYGEDERDSNDHSYETVCRALVGTGRGVHFTATCPCGEHGYWCDARR